MLNFITGRNTFCRLMYLSVSILYREDQYKCGKDKKKSPSSELNHHELKVARIPWFSFILTEIFQHSLMGCVVLSFIFLHAEL